MKLSGNKILITGGATGIGFALAERFIKENNIVIILRQKRIGFKWRLLLQASFCHYFRQCDLSSVKEREGLLTIRIQDEHKDLNVLVNNAGIQTGCLFQIRIFFERADNEITVNIRSSCSFNISFLNLNSLNTIMNVTSGLSSYL